uniref:Uncharacterized protein n=1 Tax=Ascaris lumbricoides TaxID=6252 RepID=A0A0M3IG80_ASCLU
MHDVESVFSSFACLIDIFRVHLLQIPIAYCRNYRICFKNICSTYIRRNLGNTVLAQCCLLD